MSKPTITEAQAEQMADRLIWERLATDSAYRHAENAEDQSIRENTIGVEVWADLEDRYTIKEGS